MIDETKVTDDGTTIRIQSGEGSPAGSTGFLMTVTSPTTKSVSELWDTDQAQTDEYVLHLRDPENWYEAGVKWDGCVNFYQGMNERLPEQIVNLDDMQYIHICDLEVHIKRLQEIHKKALEHFGQDWP